MKKTLVILFLLASFGEQAAFGNKIRSDNSSEFIYDCQSDREFLTTYEYLRSKASFELSPPDMRSVSLRVSQGCTGAAASFVSITELLLKANFSTNEALSTGKEIAALGVPKAKAFEEVFRLSFAEEFFDLDARSAMKVAKRLSTEFEGDPEVATKDFKSLATFCVSSVGLGLPRNQCAEVIQRVIVANEQTKVAISNAFLSAFKFLTDSTKTNFTAGDALAIAEKLASTSPSAFDVFRRSFEFAQSESGLSLSRADAAKLATELAFNTKQPKTKQSRAEGL